MSSGAERPGPPPRAATALISPMRVVAAVCVVAPFVAMLWIPSYNKENPRVLGFPFFYWYQLLWVVITAVLMIVAVLAVKFDQAARGRADGSGSGTSSGSNPGTGSSPGSANATGTPGGEEQR
jgi:Protein of unknown function (DUF3311)